ncbi:MAG TPA: tripartite tricarboxylate transporter substrate binding protein [Burkholderiales bacterium]|nr:tripartite tricarboxylate transporter substrate binding protein [Burkholderiales bacterium]
MAGFAKKRNALGHIALSLLLSLVCVKADAQWKADRPIRIIVPWSVGGSTDGMVRVTAMEMEKALGHPVVVVNQPGASGSIGTQNVVDAPRDGYTFGAGAAKDLGSYKLLGMVDTTVQNWHLYLTVAHVSVISVNATLPYRTLEELLAAMRARPGEIRVATAGINSSGHSAMQAISRAAKVEMRQLIYDGGRPAAIAAVAGEADVTTQLVAEQAVYIRAGRLRPLAVISEHPLHLDGYGRIESAARAIPGFTDPPNYFGIFVPKGIPSEMLRKLDQIWADKIASSADLQAYARTHGARFAPSFGDAAQRNVLPAIQAYAWAQHAAGRTKMSPATLGIPQP